MLFIFIVGHTRKIRAFSYSPVPTGRNTEEILRLVQALQINDLRNIATQLTGNLIVNYSSPYSK